MIALCVTRIRYIRLLVYLVSSVHAGDIEEDGDSSDHRFHGIMDI
jgi:hypothetical protein